MLPQRCCGSRSTVQSASWPEGYGRILLEEVESTNAEARSRMDAGAQVPLWVAARKQTRGRGRGGRKWSTEFGNLAASLLLPMPPGGIRRAATLSFVSGLAVSDMLQEVCGLEVRLKWPNDALASGGKISGVLLETFGPSKSIIVGIGVNLVQAPRLDNGLLRATSVLEETGAYPEFESAFNSLAWNWSTWHSRWEIDFAPIRDAWLERAALLGQRIEARLPDVTHEGRFDGIDLDGALLLQTRHGLQRIGAAEVHAA